MRESSKVVYGAYAQSLAWVMLLTAIIVGVSTVVSILGFDFFHGNSHRTYANAVLTAVLFPLLFGFVSLIGSFLTFAAPQCFQALVSDVLVRLLGLRAQFCILLALPLTAGLAWYCYDYLTPSDVQLGINAGADWTPHQHGLTMNRYLTMLVVQTPLTLFSLVYCDAAIRHGSKKSTVQAALALAVLVGVFLGLWMAQRMISGMAG
jgi:hypothetical protein